MPCNIDRPNDHQEKRVFLCEVIVSSEVFDEISFFFSRFRFPNSNCLSGCTTAKNLKED